MKNIIYLFIIILAVSCTDEVTLPSKFKDPELVVDAWLTTEDKPQTIKLTYTQDYVDTTEYRGNNDAIITVSNITQNKSYTFSPMGKGAYVFDAGKIAIVDDSLVLNVNVDGKTITSATKVYRTAIADSIKLEKRVDERPFEDGVYGALYGTDRVGVGDTYWIKTFVNDSLLNKAAELNLAYDVTFDVGSGLDGIQFISPIRSLINKTNIDGRPVPFKNGDNVRCEIHSVSNTAFFFMKNVKEQSLNGNNTIFTLPISNSQGNINGALGIFNVAEVASIERIVVD